MIVKTVWSSSGQIRPEGKTHYLVDPDRGTENLAGLLTFRTISHERHEDYPLEEFRRLHRYLEKTYPAFHRIAEREIINEMGLLYKWQGSDEEAKPLLCIAHIDVVPAEEDKKHKWTQGPFSGAVEEGYIWGRGALDIKNAVAGLLESAEFLIKDGFIPRRTIYFAFGHDEEIGGEECAAVLARRFADENIYFHAVLDEGGAIVNEPLPGTGSSAALVGIAEKGYVTLELIARGTGGHSSIPPGHTAAGKIARAVYLIEKKKFPVKMTVPLKRMFQYVRGNMSFLYRLVISNLWLFGPLVRYIMAGVPETNAIMRTTAAVTGLKGSSRENVLPGTASALINIRILPGETIESVIRRIDKIIDDTDVLIRIHGQHNDPPKISDTKCMQFTALQKAIMNTFSDVIVVPYMLVGATDSRHFQALSDTIYRFTPSRIFRSDLRGIHGINERIGVKAFHDSILCFIEIIKNLSV